MAQHSFYFRTNYIIPSIRSLSFTYLSHGAYGQLLLKQCLGDRLHVFISGQACPNALPFLVRRERELFCGLRDPSS
jgi:hypothetical protein